MAKSSPFDENPELEKLLTSAMDEVAEIISRDDGTVFGSPSSRTAAAFDQRRQDRKLKRKSRACSYPGCTQRAIAASHTIQREGPLALISENRHVLTPTLNVSKKRMSMEKVGVGEASTFRGFCPDHELLFAEFEQRRELSEDRHVALQTFRTICRELVRLQNEVTGLKDTLFAYDKAVSEYGVQAIREKLQTVKNIPADFSMTSFKVEGASAAQALAKKALKEHEELFAMLEKDFFHQALADATGKDGGLGYFSIHIEQSIPVCLAGLGNFYVQAAAKTENVHAILNIWPTTASTKILMAASEQNHDALKGYVATYFQKFAGPLTMIETWMINATDHWFIRPSVWEKLSPARQQLILDDILDDRFSIGSPYPRSIFDDLRLVGLGAARQEGVPESEIEREQAKLP